jgi:diguanylate cyclase (GGDEF)-like protein
VASAAGSAMLVKAIHRNRTGEATGMAEAAVWIPEQPAERSAEIGGRRAARDEASVAPPAPVGSASLGMRLVDEVEALKAELAAARAQIAELEVRADIDPLLDILNRRGFERELTRSLAYVKRYGTPAVLLYIDLDGFKSVNDQYGHTVGDAVLQAVAAALVGEVRASDVIGRLGGDELAILLWNVSELAAAAKAAALEQTVAAAVLPSVPTALRVGASAGIAMLDPSDTCASVIDRADRAMYARKAVRRGP